MARFVTLAAALATLSAVSAEPGEFQAFLGPPGGPGSGAGRNAVTQVRADNSLGGAYICGSFRGLNGTAADTAGYWHPSTGFQRLGAGVQGRCQAIFGFGDIVFLGGYFSSCGPIVLNAGTVAYAVCSWTRSTDTWKVWGQLGGTVFSINTLAFTASSLAPGAPADTLWVGGFFESCGPVRVSTISSACLCKWNGTQLVNVRTPALPAYGLDNQVNHLQVAEDGRSLYVCGLFTRVGGVSVPRGLVRITPATDSLSEEVVVVQPLGASGIGIGGTGVCNKVAIVPPSSLLVGGVFTSVGAVPATNLAVFDSAQSKFLALTTPVGSTSSGISDLDVSPAEGAGGTAYVVASTSTTATITAGYAFKIDLASGVAVPLRPPSGYDGFNVDPTQVAICATAHDRAGCAPRTVAALRGVGGGYRALIGGAFDSVDWPAQPANGLVFWGDLPGGSAFPATITGQWLPFGIAGAGTNDEVNVMRVGPLGLLVGGEFTFAAGSYVSGLALYSNPVPAFGAGPASVSGPVSRVGYFYKGSTTYRSIRDALVVDGPDGPGSQAYVGGEFSPSENFALCSLTQGMGCSDVRTPAGGSGVGARTSSTFRPFVASLAWWNNSVVIAGKFDYCGLSSTLNTAGVCRWDLAGRQYLPLMSSTGERVPDGTEVRALAVDEARGTLYIAPYGTALSRGTRVNYVVGFNGTSWLPLYSKPGVTNALSVGVSGGLTKVSALLVMNDVLWVAGEFLSTDYATTADRVYLNNVGGYHLVHKNWTQVTYNGVAPGASSTAVGVKGAVLVLAGDPATNSVFMAGPNLDGCVINGFSSLPCVGIARFRPGFGVDILGGGVPSGNGVLSLLMMPPRTLLVGGYIDTLAGRGPGGADVAANNLVMLDVTLPSASPSPVSATSTASRTPAATSPLPTGSGTNTASPSWTGSVTSTASVSISLSATGTSTLSISMSRTTTGSNTATVTASVSTSFSGTVSTSLSSSITAAASPSTSTSFSGTVSTSLSASITAAASPSTTAGVSASNTGSFSTSDTATASRTAMPTTSSSATSTASKSSSQSLPASIAASPTASTSLSASETPSPATSGSSTSTRTASETTSASASASIPAALSLSASATGSKSPLRVGVTIGVSIELAGTPLSSLRSSPRGALALRPLLAALRNLLTGVLAGALQPSPPDGFRVGVALLFVQDGRDPTQVLTFAASDAVNTGMGGATGGTSMMQRREVRRLQTVLNGDALELSLAIDVPAQGATAQLVTALVSAALSSAAGQAAIASGAVAAASSLGVPASALDPSVTAVMAAPDVIPTAAPSGTAGGGGTSGSTGAAAGPDVGAIVGGILGGIAALTLLAFGALYLSRRKVTTRRRPLSGGRNQNNPAYRKTSVAGVHLTGAKIAMSPVKAPVPAGDRVVANPLSSVGSPSPTPVPAVMQLYAGTREFAPAARSKAPAARAVGVPALASATFAPTGMQPRASRVNSIMGAGDSFAATSGTTMEKRPSVPGAAADEESW